MEISIYPSQRLPVTVFDAIRHSNICIKELTLKGFIMNSTNIQRISTIKTLHVLNLPNVIFDARVESDLILLATELPLLMEIDVRRSYEHSMSITVDGLKKMIENGKQLNCINLGKVRDLHIDKTAIDTILNAIQSDTGLFIQFKGCKHKTSFVVPDDHEKSSIYKFKSGNKRFEIKYEECARCYC